MLAGAFLGAVAVIVLAIISWMDGKTISLPRQSTVILAVALAAAAWMARYDVTGISRGDQWPVGYVLDRWTGDLVMCNATTCYPTKAKSEINQTN